MEKKWFFVADQYGNECTVQAISPRQAVIAAVNRQRCLSNPKLEKTYADSKDGNTYHVGYSCGRYWYSVGEIHFLREAV